jgi:adenylosuccinate synthase
MTAVLVAGLGFGDEGKGSIIDHLAHTTSASLVVRFSGGAQAAHNVVTNSGHHHTFSQFGSGMFAGAKTHLSRFMLVNPFNLENEAEALTGLGFQPYEWLTVEREALVTTHYHLVANRLKELLRGKDRHGSCGCGIGETVADSLAGVALRVADLVGSVHNLQEKLYEIKGRKLKEIGELRPDLYGDTPRGALIRKLSRHLNEDTANLVFRYNAIGKRLQVVDRDYLPKQIKTGSTVIFEGAQGVLLDQDYGFHPYTTWSDTTFGNAYKLLEGYDGPVRKIGVLRGYMTRHGAGPFPTEVADDNPLEAAIQTDLHNKWGQYQEHFRLGHFDAVLAHYALEVIGGVDELAITNLDKLGPKPRICTKYWKTTTENGRWPVTVPTTTLNVQRPTTLEHQATLAEVLTNDIQPSYEMLPDRPSIVDRIAHELGVPVTLCSIGPQTKDKWPTQYLRDAPWNS